MSVIQCINLGKKFPNKEAINNINLSIDEGKIIGLIGRNGAGKTTLMKLISGQLKPSNGEIKLWGEEVFDNLSVLKKLIYMDEGKQYDSSLKLQDILMLYSIHYDNWDNEFAEKLIKYFELDKNAKFTKLSRGMKSQFNFITALCTRAPLTLMDEPTLGLDAASRKDFYNILLKHYMDNPRTIIISSHLLSEVEQLLEEIILIDKGSVILHRPLEEMQEYAVAVNGKTELVNNFIGDKEILKREKQGNAVRAVIRYDLSDIDVNYIEKNSLKLDKVSVEDLCIYLTNKEKESIFDEAE